MDVSKQPSLLAWVLLYDLLMGLICALAFLPLSVARLADAAWYWYLAAIVSVVLAFAGVPPLLASQPWLRSKVFRIREALVDAEKRRDLSGTFEDLALAEKVLFFCFLSCWIFASVVPGPVTIRITAEAYGLSIAHLVGLVWMVLMVSLFFAAWRISRYLAVNCLQRWR
jgi:hypothetical protein